MKTTNKRMVALQKAFTAEHAESAEFRESVLSVQNSV